MSYIHTLSYFFGMIRRVWSRRGSVARPNEPDMPPKRTKKVRLDINSAKNPVGIGNSDIIVSV